MRYEHWVDLVPSLLPDLEQASAQRVRIWSLVLSSQFIDHRVRGSRGHWEIWVRNDAAEEAISQIRSYEEENSELTPTWLPARTFSAAQTSFAVLAAIALAHAITGFGVGISRSLWLSVGSADAGLILRGELWRLATALTLHADVIHLMSNVVIGGFFVLWLCKEVGVGLGWLSTLLSGVTGNLINSLVQSPIHNAIGASTALFGAIGILSGLRAHESASASRSVIIPLMSGMILLGLLGTAGERTDVGAHLFGLLCGVAIGAALSSWLKSHPVPQPGQQRALGIAATVLPLLAWWWGLAVKL